MKNLRDMFVWLVGIGLAASLIFAAWWSRESDLAWVNYQAAQVKRHGSFVVNSITRKPASPGTLELFMLVDPKGGSGGDSGFRCYRVLPEELTDPSLAGRKVRLVKKGDLVDVTFGLPPAPADRSMLDAKILDERGASFGDVLVTGLEIVTPEK